MFANEQLKQASPCVFVIFGGTGDLTKRKLIPALFRLFKGGKLAKEFAAVAVGRRDLTDNEYRDAMKAAMIGFVGAEFQDADWDAFSKLLFYRKADFSKENGGYDSLSSFLSILDVQFQTLGNRIFYLAVAPSLFEPIISNLKTNGMLENSLSWQRVLVEKPFGTDLATAKKLNDSIIAHLPEDKLFRIDHYLAKEMIQNIIAIRFGNMIFESLWSNRFIDNVQITAFEEIGVENRGPYYESAGVLKDMLQNHLLQMLSLICMELPSSLDAESIKIEKVRVLESLERFNESSAETDIVFGQYGKGFSVDQVIPGYREEEGVSPTSHVPTYVALKAQINNDRWKDVPFYIRTGKSLSQRISEIVIQFKQLPRLLDYEEFRNTQPDYLILKIQPSEGMQIQMNAKRPGSEFIVDNIKLDYCQECVYKHNSPEAYERLILEAIRNNSSLFTSWEELECSWNYIESIERHVRPEVFAFPNYAAGSDGPAEAANLLQRDGRTWRERK